MEYQGESRPENNYRDDDSCHGQQKCTHRSAEVILSGCPVIPLLNMGHLSQARLLIGLILRSETLKAVLTGKLIVLLSVSPIQCKESHESPCEYFEARHGNGKPHASLGSMLSIHGSCRVLRALLPSLPSRLELAYKPPPRSHRISQKVQATNAPFKA